MKSRKNHFHKLKLDVKDCAFKNIYNHFNILTKKKDFPLILKMSSKVNLNTISHKRGI